MPDLISNPPRVGLPDAISRVLETLQRVPSTSVSGLARATGLDRRTVTKVLDVVLRIQDVLKDVEIARVRQGRSYVIQLRERTERARRLFSSLRRRMGRAREE